MLLNKVRPLLVLANTTAARNPSLFKRITYTAQYCTSQQNTRTPEDLKNFKPVYKLTYIIHARLICRLKLYQTAFVLCLTGASIVSQVELFIPLAICTVSLTMLGIMGEFFRKLIGILYVNSATDEVRIAYLNFWGNRKEIIQPINNIVPPCDIGEDLSDTYVKFTFADKSIHNLYLSIKYGQVLDRDLLGRVVGEKLKS